MRRKNKTRSVTVIPNPPSVSDIAKDHVDDFIDTPTWRPDASRDYARFVLNLMRLPAHLQCSFRPWIMQHPLFATYEGKRYRVTGASRLGDVWLARDMQRTVGYDLRVQIDKCSEWGDSPYPVDAVPGDKLPPIGSKVEIHLASSDKWVEHEVIGYYAWGDFGGNESLHRVFVQVRDKDGYPNARLLKDVRQVKADV